MKVQYKLTLDDAAAFLRYHAKHSRQGMRASQQRWLWLALFAVGALFLVLLSISRREPVPFASGGWLFVLLFVGYGLFFLFGGRIREAGALKQLRRNRQFFDERSLEISAVGLTAATEAVSNSVKWHAVNEIIQHGDHAFFYVSKSEAHILPKRVFADEEQFQEFVEKAEWYRWKSERIDEEQPEEGK
jgi:hypothetical protein